MKSIHGMIEELRLYWKNYLFQSIIATFAIFVVIFFLRSLNMVIVASIGASTFVVFAMPQHITAKSRNVIGGHLVRLVAGSLFALIPHNSLFLSTIVYALAVGCSIFIMVIIDTEHPPASGTALGVTMSGFSITVAIAIVASVVVLSLIRHFFKRYLRDLT